LDVKLKLQAIVLKKAVVIYFSALSQHSCEHGNNAAGSKKGGEFIDRLSDCRQLMK
jgi:hypothetical protein